jgi:hypothetical protein
VDNRKLYISLTKPADQRDHSRNKNPEKITGKKLGRNLETAYALFLKTRLVPRLRNLEGRIKEGAFREDFFIA